MPPRFRRIAPRAAAALLLGALTVALVLAGVWWDGTRRDRSAALQRLDEARKETAELESLAAVGERMRDAWEALGGVALRAASRSAGVRAFEQDLSMKARRAGLRVERIRVTILRELATDGMGAVLEAEFSAQGSSVALVNWMHLVEQSDAPVIWFEKTRWESSGDPRRMTVDARLRTIFLPNQPDGAEG